LATPSRLRGRRWVVAGTAAVALAACGVATAAAAGVIPLNPFGTSKVGQQSNGRVLLPDNQWVAPYGHRTTFNTESVGTAASPDGTKIAVQLGGESSHYTDTPASIKIVDAATGDVLQTFGGAGAAAPVYSPDGAALYVATTVSSSLPDGGANSVLKYTVGPDGLITNPSSPTKTALPALAGPYGMAVSADGTKLYGALNGTNELGVIDATTMQLKDRIRVGQVPNGVVIVGNEAFVSNRGGRVPVAGETTNKSDGTAVVSDPSTGASTTGTVSVVNLATDTVTGTINVGLQPAAMTVHDGSIFVANTNDDTVSIVDADSHKVTQTFNVEPLPGSTVGAKPNSIAFVDAHHLLVSVGGDNAIAEFAYNGPRTPVG
jgi:YVTN family beta-propeller protein